MAREADCNFADFLSLRCPSRADELTAVLPQARRDEVRGLLQENIRLERPEIVRRVTARLAAPGVLPEDLASLPPVFRKRLALVRSRRAEALR